MLPFLVNKDEYMWNYVITTYRSGHLTVRLLVHATTTPSVSVCLSYRNRRRRTTGYSTA